MAAESQKTNSGQKKPNKPESRSYLRYTSLFFQMLVTVGALAWLGNWLDGHWQLEYPLLTIAGMFLGLGASFYQIFKALNDDA